MTRSMMVVLVLACVVLGFASPSLAHSAEEGARLASQYCAECHERGGENDPPSFARIAADPWWTSWELQKALTYGFQAGHRGTDVLSLRLEEIDPSAPEWQRSKALRRSHGGYGQSFRMPPVELSLEEVNSLIDYFISLRP